MTSQSIWENAVGWLKNHENQNIKWIAYGKAKLKGIYEHVDIYCFYAAESGKPAPPGIIKKKKLKNRSIFIAGIILFLLAAFVTFQKAKQMNRNAIEASQVQIMGSYYVQFDFSDFKNQPFKNQNKTIVDTVALQERFLSQLITVFSPDSVATELDLIKQFSKTGEFYYRRQNTSSDDSYFFRDTLNFYGSIFITASKISSSNNDSLRFHIRMDMYPKYIGSSASERIEWFSLSNIETPFRNLIQDMMMATSEKIWTIQGYVSNSNDSIVYFRLTKDAGLRVGALIEFRREYIGMDGLKKRAENLRERITYFKNIPEDSTILKGFSKEYEEIETDIKNSHSRGSWSTSSGINMRGKVTELYDSTGKASWTHIGKFPNDQPQKGDVIYLAF